MVYRGRPYHEPHGLARLDTEGGLAEQVAVADG